MEEGRERGSPISPLACAAAQDARFSFLSSPRGAVGRNSWTGFETAES